MVGQGMDGDSIKKQAIGKLDVRQAVLFDLENLAALFDVYPGR